MSFNDFSSTKHPMNSAGNSPKTDLSSNSDKDPISMLRNLISSFQKSCLAVKDKITEMRRRKVSQSEKSQLDLQIKDLRVQETTIKTQFDIRQKDLDRLSKNDAALQRATLAKLYKDYERLKASLESISSEAQLVKPVIDAPSSNNSSFARTGNNNMNTMMYVEEDNNKNDNTIVVNSGGQKLVLKPLIQSNDVDDMIIEEREKEIKKLHQDLLLVHDMYREMADIVDKQGVQIDNIHKTTEESHQRAESGLEQVKQAASYQPTCTIS